ncbi:recombinase family protein [Paenibacillus elgii]|uniref:recombinase family protein n=1 Tax=Paenibacillus elgii TaxID=189691 RepID=UPI00203A4342|nr:recombinase family protein [Paenibacillus elgii]MCM3273916.1 recombinase family protein [Paenibacillus elgii]
MLNRPIKAGSYSRISRDEDKKNYDTILSQNSINENYAKTKFAVEIVDYYIDDNWSGYTLERPDFNRLKRDVEIGRINTIIAKDLSRIGRHNANTLNFFEDMKKKGVRIIAVTDAYDSFVDDDDLIGIKTWYNEMYVKDISKKTKNNIAIKMENGKYVCAVPFGYKRHPIEKHIILVDEECAWVVKKIYKLYLEGHGYRSIAAILTEAGDPTPSVIIKRQKEAQGKVCKKNVTYEWSQKMVMIILHNDFYIGVLRQGKYKTVEINGKGIETSEEEQHVFFDNHEAIVNKEDFGLVQKITLERSTSNYRGNGKKHQNLFSGFMYCADCGSYMTALNKSGKNKSYICGTYNRRGKNFCSTHYVLDTKLVIGLKVHLSNVRAKLYDTITRMKTNVGKNTNPHENIDFTLRRLEQELKQAGDELKVLYSQKIKDIAKNPDMEEFVTETYAELEKDKQQNRQSIKLRLDELYKLKGQEGKIEKDAKTALQIFDDILNKEQIERRDLELIIDKIVIDIEGIPAYYLKGDIDVILNDCPDTMDDEGKGTLCIHKRGLMASKA